MKEQVTLVIMAPLHLVKVDGRIVTTHGDMSVFKLPAGEHELNFSFVERVNYADKSVTWTADDLTVTYTFAVGETYTASWMTDAWDGLAKITGGERSAAVSKINITSIRKNSSAITVAYETAILMGLGMDLANTVGLTFGIQPVGFVFDMGKVSLGLNTDLIMNAGWAGKKNSPFPMGLTVSGGGLVGLYINRNNGKAFGLGAGGGYIADAFNMVDEYAPVGVPYLRAAIIPSRIYQFKIYFDYYLKDVAKIKQPEFDEPFDINTWNGWGIGVSIRMR
jgi:hypothetical protein